MFGPSMTWRLWKWKLPANVRRQIRIDPVTHCWMWQGATNGEWHTKGWGGGYGFAWIDQRMVRVHRLVYELLIGPAGEMLMHVKCANRRCCNPNHCEPGDNRLNQLERWERQHDAANAA